ncbi:DMT family transporter [Desulfospira joergensenii]|uniref:DMT family transporter n=1 Tax=Desulfospira joergensenii TaxID=53329 RepID=UPI0003B373A8|nr:DMT family transporter [Desulfospira joergensenii]
MMNPETLALSYGIGSAIAWGAGDFSGGLASKKGNLLGVVLISQSIGGLLLAVAALVFSEPFPPMEHIGFGALAGMFGILGLLALYHGLAQGRMGIVAPLSAVLTALVPIGYTAFYTGLPTHVQLAGFFFFMAAVWLLSSGDAAFRMTLDELFLSVSAGLGFGLFFIFIDKANDLAVFWPLVGARIASVSFLLMIILFSGKRGVPVRGQWSFILITGILDATGNCLFSLAAQLGRLDIAAVLGSLYPASTVMLAWFFLREKLRRQQWIGVASAFIALVLISV